MSNIKKDSNDDKKGEDAATREARARAVAIRHALSLEDKKKLQTRVLDMIVLLFDLPSEETTDPVHPAKIDAQAFRECLAIFRPSDLDEAVQERNIDNRCGYAMCRRPNVKLGASTRWDSKVGKFVERPDNMSWCSLECKERNAFVRSQLSLEPAWLRQQTPEHIRLLSDVASTDSDTLPTHLERLQIQESSSTHQDTQEMLAIERGEPHTRVGGDIPILEKETTKPTEPPRYNPSIAVNDVLEGLPIRSIGRKLPCCALPIAHGRRFSERGGRVGERPLDAAGTRNSVVPSHAC